MHTHSIAAIRSAAPLSSRVGEEPSNHRTPPPIMPRRFADVRREAECIEPMLKAWREVYEAKRAMHAAKDADTALLEKVRNDQPERPAAILKKCDYGDGLQSYPMYRDDIVEEIERARRGFFSKTEVAKWEGRLTAYDAFQKRLDEWREAVGLEDLRREYEAAEAMLDDAEERFKAVEPATTRGVAIKLRFLLRCWYLNEEMNEPPALLTASAIRALVRLRRAGSRTHGR